MKSLAVVSMLAACSYTPLTGRDAMVANGDDATQPSPDGPNATVAPCSAPDPTGLVLCLEMEDIVTDGSLADSSTGHHDATAQNLTTTTRTVPGTSPAIEIGATTVVRSPRIRRSIATPPTRSRCGSVRTHCRAVARSTG